MATPEATFHSVFTSTNRRLRNTIKALRGVPAELVLESLALEIEVTRLELWDDWKRHALSAEMAAVVAEVRDPHHGPFIVQHGSVKAFGPYLRQALDEMEEQLMPIRELRSIPASVRILVDDLAVEIEALREAWSAAMAAAPTSRPTA
jgi:hypothetical protein